MDEEKLKKAAKYIADTLYIATFEESLLALKECHGDQNAAI